MIGNREELRQRFPHKEFATGSDGDTAVGKVFYSSDRSPGEDPFIRPALVLAPHECLSLDVVTKDGKRIAQINLTQSRDGAWANIDVIPEPEITATVMTWDKGTNELEIELPKGKMVAVNLERKS